MFFTNKRDKRFFDLFIEGATNLANGIKAFEGLLDNFDQLEERAGKLKRLEDEGDRITHEIINELNRTFVTPLDREDILILAGKLDDIIDYIEAASARMVSYRVAEPGPHVHNFARVLSQCSDEILQAFLLLREKKFDKIRSHCIELNRLENDGDDLLRHVMRDLFSDPKRDPIEIIKWKEIYETLEIATDNCEDIANVLESVVVKHA